MYYTLRHLLDLRSKHLKSTINTLMHIIKNTSLYKNRDDTFPKIITKQACEFVFVIEYSRDKEGVHIARCVTQFGICWICKSELRKIK